MKQRDLLNAIVTKLKAVNGYDYAIDYTPRRNVSDQPSGTIYRCVTPGAMRKEATTRGELLTYQEVTIAHFATIPGDNDAEIIANQEEIETILSTFMSRANPVIFAGVYDEATVKAAESQTYADDGIIKDALESEPRTMIAAVTITFLIC